MVLFADLYIIIIISKAHIVFIEINFQICIAIAHSNQGGSTMNKSRRRKFSKTLLCLASAAAMLSVSSCGVSNAGKEKKMKKVAVICKNSNVAFWDEVKQGAKDACDEMGITLSYYCAQNDNDYATQQEYLTNAIRNKVNAIVIAPNSTTDLNQLIAEAANNGIKVININSKAESDKVLSVISSSDKDAGTVAARNVARILASKGTYESKPKSIAIIGHTAATAAERISGFKNEMISQLKAFPTSGIDSTVSPDIVFVEAEQTGQKDKAYEQTKMLLEANPDIAVVFATNTNTTLGACEAVAELDQNRPIVIGFNSDEAEISYIKDGILNGTIIQNPYIMGYVGVRYAEKAVEGKEIPTSLDTGVTYISAENLNNDDVQLLLYPEKFKKGGNK